MLRKLAKPHLVALLIYLAVVTILGWEFPRTWGMFFDLVGLWIGGVIGLVLLGLDRVIQVYVGRSHEQLSQQVQSYLKKGQWKDALETLLARREEQSNLAFRNGVFGVVFLPVLFFGVTSSASLFGKGLVVGVMLHFLYDAWRDQLKRPEHLNKWLFWMVSRDVTMQEQRALLWILTGLFALFTLLLV